MNPADERTHLLPQTGYSEPLPVTIPRLPQLLAAAAVIAGVAAWVICLQEGLVLSHYDAKAHLVVARRVIDSLTPGWQQLGAVWLPLPHLIQLLPTQIDLFYRTGAFASAVSIASFAVTVWAASTLVLRITGSAAGAATAAALFILNPNLLYLQSTPMTEPLLLAMVFLVVLRLHEWVALTASGPAEAGHRDIRRTLGWTLFAAAWTRYEAWPVIFAGLAGAAFAMWRRADSPALISARLARAAVWPAAAAVLFALNSRVTVGSWLVDGGFYEIDPLFDGRPWRSLVAVWWGTHQLSGYAIETVGLATAAWLTMRALTRRDAAALLVPVALLAAAALPFYAFSQGHPYRVRYMVPSMAACVFFCGLAVGTLRRPIEGHPAVGTTLAALLVSASLIESPPFGSRAPLVDEAQWDVPRSVDRRAVTACLASDYRGELVMASMGSLAHYMQELSHEGFAIADFL